MNTTMQIKSLNPTYDLIEFNYYANHIDDNQLTQIVDLSLNNSLNEFKEEDFSTLFTVEINNQTLIFSGYTIDEFYEQNGLLKVICVKQ